MDVLVVGASGSTGRLLVEQMLQREVRVRVIVRSAASMASLAEAYPSLSVVEASLLELADDELARYVQGCAAVASCLGHNLTFKGLFGHPRRLVTDAVRRLCGAIRAAQPATPVKYVLMNTTGNRNRDIDEPVSIAQHLLLGIIRALLPPHSDNEHAADYLRIQVGQNDGQIEWVAVRPDGLIDEPQVSDYDLYPSPIRSAVFDAGQTSRINVANFMARLITEDDLWQRWKGQMPVIYNREGRD